MSMQYQLMNPPVQNPMGAHLHTPPSVFQHMMGQQNAPQEAEQWMQMPQVPQLLMPWSVPSLQHPDVVRFTGEKVSPKGFPLHQKRKLEMPDLIETRQSKQFITEEKMAAHFREMHISPAFQDAGVSQASTSAIPSAQECNQFNTCLDLEMNGVATVNLENVKGNSPKLILSEELKRIREEPLLPASLLSKLERPSMALVLWEPPNKHLRVLPIPRDTPTPIPNASDDNNNVGDPSNDGGSNNNNNESILNMNQVYNDSSIPSLEPMDL